jgi:hypothetical protein
MIFVSRGFVFWQAGECAVSISKVIGSFYKMEESLIYIIKTRMVWILFFIKLATIFKKLLIREQFAKNRQEK